MSNILRGLNEGYFSRSEQDQQNAMTTRRSSDLSSERNAGLNEPDDFPSEPIQTRNGVYEYTVPAGQEDIAQELGLQQHRGHWVSRMPIQRANFQFGRPQFHEIPSQGAAADSLNEFAPGSGGSESGRWYTDDQMIDIVGDGWYEDLDVSGNISKQQMIQEAQAWLDDQGYNVQVLNCRLNDDDMDWYIEGNFHNPGFAKKGVAEGLNDTQKKIEDTINKLEDRLKHAKSDEQWDRISARIERLQAGLKRSKQGVAEAVTLDRSSNPKYPNDPATVKHRLDSAKAILSDPNSDPDSRREAAAIIAKSEQGVAEGQLDELSNKTLASYKKKAGADATQADKRGDYARGDKRMSGIVRATKKEFDNDAKGVAEEKVKGVDGKACWQGKRYAGKVKKADGTYKDKCVPVKESNSSILEGIQQVDEINWKHAAAAGAMALGALGGAGQAQAQFNPAGLSTVYLQQVVSGEHQRPTVSVDAAKAELQARADGKQQKVSSQSDTSSKPFTPVDYQTKEPLKKGPDGKWYNSNGEERDGLHGGPVSAQGTAMFRGLKLRQ